MVPQLSTSDEVSQLHKMCLLVQLAQRLLFTLPILLLMGGPHFASAQNPDFDRLVEPLTAIDQQFMRDQRIRVEQLANRLGRNLSGAADRDVETLQRMLDERLVAPTDTLTLQAMGIVFGDLLSNRLDMDWAVYRDKKGRSRALRYREMEVYLFPVTMISRRHESGSNRRLKPLFDEIVHDTRLLLPGGKWFQ